MERERERERRISKGKWCPGFGVGGRM